MHTNSRFSQKKVELVVFILIISTAVLFRFYHIDITPPGLWVDEAANGTDALRALETGDFKIFYPNNNGREGLFIGLQALSIKAFGNTAWALRLVSATIGTLTVVGLYLLARQLFTWQLAAVASFFMAISLWPVIFSRIGFRAIMVPLVLTWGFYFLWRGLKKFQTGDFIVAGVIAGIGFYTYPAYRVAPLILGALILNYWLHLKDDYDITHYKYFQKMLFRKIGIMMIATCIVALPFLVSFAQQFSDFTTRESSLSVLKQEKPLIELGKSVGLTLGMFNFNGDWNLRHNIPGEPLLAWPVGIFFVIGFIHELIHWLKRKHGHFSTTHTLLFSWFFAMLVPGFLSLEAPHALRAIGTIPVVMIFAAQGLLWLLGKISKWYAINEPTYHINKEAYRHEAKVISVIAIVLLLVATAGFEWNRYFNVWAKHQHISYAFTEHLSDIGTYLNNNPSSTPTYIIPNEPGIIVDEVSIFAEPIKYLTAVYDKAPSETNKIFYIDLENLSDTDLPTHYRIIFTKNDIGAQIWAARQRLQSEQFERFTVYSK